MSKDLARGPASYEREELLIALVPELLRAKGFRAVRTVREGGMKLVDATSSDSTSLRFWLKQGWATTDLYSAVQFGMLDRSAAGSEDEIFVQHVWARVASAKAKGATHAKRFYEAGRQVRESSKDERFKRELDLITDERLLKIWFTDEIDSRALDPAVPALFQHLVTWGTRKRQEFDVVHDRSKPVLASQADFEEMMALAGDQIRSIGTDRRKIEFPLRARTLTQADSKDHSQLQVADLCAGITSHLYRCMLDGSFDELGEAAKALGCVEWAVNGLFPEPKVTPEALGTSDISGSNSTEEMSRYLYQKRMKRKQS